MNKVHPLLMFWTPSLFVFLLLKRGTVTILLTQCLNVHCMLGSVAFEVIQEIRGGGVRKGIEKGLVCLASMTCYGRPGATRINSIDSDLLLWLDMLTIIRLFGGKYQLLLLEAVQPVTARHPTQANQNLLIPFSCSP